MSVVEEAVKPVVTDEICSFPELVQKMGEVLHNPVLLSIALAASPSFDSAGRKYVSVPRPHEAFEYIKQRGFSDATAAKVKAAARAFCLAHSMGLKTWRQLQEVTSRPANAMLEWEAVSQTGITGILPNAAWRFCGDINDVSGWPFLFREIVNLDGCGKLHTSLDFDGSSRLRVDLFHHADEWPDPIAGWKNDFDKPFVHGWKFNFGDFGYWATRETDDACFSVRTFISGRYPQLVNQPPFPRFYKYVEITRRPKGLLRAEHVYLRLPLDMLYSDASGASRHVGQLWYEHRMPMNDWFMVLKQKYTVTYGGGQAFSAVPDNRCTDSPLQLVRINNPASSFRTDSLSALAKSSQLLNAQLDCVQIATQRWLKRIDLEALFGEGFLRKPLPLLDYFATPSDTTA